MATQITAGPQPTAAPLSLANTSLEPITPLSISATFDGSGAGADFMPCVSFYTTDGRLIGRFQGEATVTAGDTAQETFAPFLSKRSSGNGIEYDKENVGDWLHVETTGSSGVGAMVFDALTGEIRFFADDSLNGAFRVNAPFIRLDTTNGSFRILDTGETFMDMAGDANWNFSEITISAGPITFVISNAGTVFEIQDHLGAAKWRWTEGTTVLHGPTGGSIVFDL